MLIRFNFRNFKSFKNENCLNMEATSLKEHEYNVVKTENGDFLKVAAIYGANASGKTNVLQGFCYMVNKVLKSDDSMNYIPEENYFSYMMNDDPISFEVEILAKNGKVYEYGFEILKNIIISEWLYIKRINKFYTIFDRDNNKVTLKINNKTREFENIDNKSLFLNVYSRLERNNEDFNNVDNWFKNSYYFDLGNPQFQESIMNKISLKVLSDKKYKKELIRFIKTFESDILDIKNTPETVEEVKHNNGFVKLELIHQGENGTNKALPLEFESNGTRKMIYLFDFLMEALRSGMVLFIDELDAKLHPLLTKYIINLFHKEETNIGNGQLIYSTHDTVNLNKNTFRRDEIWFTEKEINGISKLYSLSDYKINNSKVRNDAIYNKDYLTGRYGAIPVLEDFDLI